MTPEQIQLLEEWRLACAEVATTKPIVEREQALRKQVFASFFPKPEEGTNTIELMAGWKLKGTHKLDRKLDEAAFPAVAAQFKDLGLNAEVCIEYKIVLKTKEFKELTAEQRLVFEQCLTIKPASPSLELVAPKEKK